jgi:hypothetical protein
LFVDRASDVENGASGPMRYKMRLIFTKRSGKHDELAIERDDGRSETLSCPKQGIIPHDMVHFAVESVLSHRGFLGLVADGQAAAFTTAGGDSEEAIERLVEGFQAEMWGGRVSATDLLDTYEQACGDRGHAAVPISLADVDAIRTRLDQLSADWLAVPLNGSLALDMESGRAA